MTQIVSIISKKCSQNNKHALGRNSTPSNSLIAKTNIITADQWLLFVDNRSYSAACFSQRQMKLRRTFILTARKQRFQPNKPSSNVKAERRKHLHEWNTQSFLTFSVAAFCRWLLRKCSAGWFPGGHRSLTAGVAPKKSEVRSSAFLTPIILFHL